MSVTSATPIKVRRPFGVSPRRDRQEIHQHSAILTSWAGLASSRKDSGRQMTRKSSTPPPPPPPPLTVMGPSNDWAYSLFNQFNYSSSLSSILGIPCCWIFMMLLIFIPNLARICISQSFSVCLSSCLSFSAPLWTLANLQRYKSSLFVSAKQDRVILELRCSCVITFARPKW